MGSINRGLRKNFYIVVFILPAIGFLFTFFILPNILNFYYSLTDWNAYRDEANFVGFRNFIELIEEKILLSDLRVTLIYALLVMAIENSFGLMIALLIENTGSTLLDGLWRTVFFIPVLVSPLAAGYMFRAIFHREGAINQILSAIMQIPITYDYLADTRLVILFVALVHSWKWVGVVIIVYLAGLLMIPYELLEAAKMEGANPWQTIRKIKIPLIGPSITFNVALELIGALYILDFALAMTKGGPARASEVLSIFVLEKYGTGRYGIATAISLILFLVIAFIAIPLIMFLRKREAHL